MENEQLAVAVIGLGGIAQNAYLPVLGTRADLRLRLMTRSRDRLDALGDGHHLDVADLADGPTGWTPVARVKGVEQICGRFLAAVRGETEYPDLQDALATHELCELVVERLDG